MTISEKYVQSMSKEEQKHVRSLHKIYTDYNDDSACCNSFPTLWSRVQDELDAFEEQYARGGRQAYLEWYGNNKNAMTEGQYKRLYKWLNNTIHLSKGQSADHYIEDFQI